MKNSRLFIAASLLLGLFFLLQTGAGFFSSGGSGMKPEKRAEDMRLSMKLFPVLGDSANEAGFALLEKGSRDRDPAIVEASIPYFLAALKKNPLDYRSRYYLAKAYLQTSAADADRFERGVLELKRAARLRGSNRQIAVDCAGVFFSLWPLLEKDDQEFAFNLLAGVMPVLDWGEFAPLLEMWSLYVLDVRLLMDLLRLRPEFFGPAADQLVAASLPMAQRHELLDLYEIHVLDAVERRFNELSLLGAVGLEDARSLLNQLQGLKGYHRLQPGSAFPQEKFAKLRRALLLDVISGLLAAPGAQEDPAIQAQLREQVEAYIPNHFGLSDLDELQALLADYSFFKENDFASLRIKTLIAFQKSDYSGVIADTEAMRNSISFVKKEQAADYTAILLMLIDSYYSTKLLTAAEGVARELYQAQPDNPDVLYRVLRIKNILGTEGTPDKMLNEKLARVENSRFLNIATQGPAPDVYILNQPEIEIVIDPALVAAAGSRKLLQVFVNDQIAYECYADAIPPKIVIGPPFVVVERKALVRVSIR